MSLVLSKQRREFETVSNFCSSFGLEQMLKTLWIDISSWAYRRYVVICPHFSLFTKKIKSVRVALRVRTTIIRLCSTCFWHRSFQDFCSTLNDFVRVLFNISLKLPWNLCEFWRLFYQQHINLGYLFRLTTNIYEHIVISHVHL
jgi:hypothetical protein